MSSMGFTRTVGTGGIPVWQGVGKDIQLFQGGFKLADTGLAAGAKIPAGTPVVVSETARTATIFGTGVMYADAASNATDYQLVKGHTLKVGDYLASGAAGGKAYAITAIDDSNDDYDVATVGTTIGAVTAGTTVYASTATGATSSAYPAINGALYEDYFVPASGIVESVSVVLRGIVYANRVPYSTQIAALLTKITYSLSK